MLACEHGEHPPLDAGSRMAQAFHCDGLRMSQACFAGGPEVAFSPGLPPFYDVAGSISRADPCLSLAGRGPYQDSTLTGLRP